MPQQLMLFDDAAFHQTGEYVLATRQIVFGVQFGDDDKLGAVYEFFANESTAQAFRKVMTEFINMARQVHGITLPRVPRNSGVLARLSEQAKQLKEAEEGNGGRQKELPPAVVVGKPADPPATGGTITEAGPEPWEGFWQKPPSASNTSKIGQARAAMREEIRQWAVKEGLASPDDFGRGRIPTEIGMKWGYAHRDRIPKRPANA